MLSKTSMPKISRIWLSISPVVMPLAYMDRFFLYVLTDADLVLFSAPGAQIPPSGPGEPSCPPLESWCAAACGCTRCGCCLSPCSCSRTCCNQGPRPVPPPGRPPCYQYSPAAATPDFFRRAFSSGVRFFLAIFLTSYVVLQFYTTSEVYTNFGILLILHKRHD